MTYHCEVCDGEIERWYKGRKYCSRACMGKAWTHEKVIIDCACGCGEKLVETYKGVKRRYIFQHRRRTQVFDYKREAKSKLYKGGWVAKNGYRYRNVHSGFTTGQVPEHRYVMEQHLKRKLDTREQVHHINHNKLDNGIENLIVLNISEHAKLHQSLRRQRAIT